MGTQIPRKHDAQRWILRCLILLLASCVRGKDPDFSDSSPKALAACPLRSTARAYPSATRPPLVQPRTSYDPLIVKRPAHLAKAFSKDTTLFGVEIEFPVADGFSLRKASEKFSQKVKAQCDLCSGLCHSAAGNIVVLQDDKKTPQPLILKVSVDPGVIEVKTSPLTYQQMESWKDEIDVLIFATAKDLQGEGTLRSSEFERNRWSGHTNVSWPGLSSAREHDDGESMNLLLNFFVDLQNFPELAMGVLGGDIRNATPLAFGSQEDQEKLKTVIKLYKEGAFSDLKTLARRLYDVHPSAFLGSYGDNRYSLINLASVASLDARWGYEKGTRMELRGFFAPQKVEDMLAHMRIINGRLDYLKRSFPAGEKKTVAYHPPPIDPSFLKGATLDSHQTSGLIGGLSPKSAAKSYITYLTQAGLDPKAESQYLRDENVRKTVLQELSCRASRLSSE